MIIDIHLSAGGFSKAANELRKYAKSLEKKTERLVSDLGQAGIEYANMYLAHDDTGETRNSISFDHKKNEGVLSVGGAAVWIEFGTGVLANAGNSPHPKRDEAGAVPWGTYGKGLGIDIWEFPSRQYGWIPTAGIPMNPFMYETAQSLRFELTDFAKEAFRDD